MEHLETLTRSAHDAYGWSFVRHIRFSKLRILTWTVRPYSERQFSEEFQNDLFAFFSSLPDTLETLELFCVWYGYRIMKALLTSIPQITELVLRGCDTITRLMAVSMIGRLSNGLIENTKGEKSGS